MPIPPPHLHRLTASPHSSAPALPHPSSSFLQVQDPKLISSLHPGTHSPGTSQADFVAASMWLQGPVLRLYKIGALQCTVGKRNTQETHAQHLQTCVNFSCPLLQTTRRNCCPELHRGKRGRLSACRLKLIQPLWGC